MNIAKKTSNERKRARTTPRCVQNTNTHRTQSPICVQALSNQTNTAIASVSAVCHTDDDDDDETIFAVFGEKILLNK